MKRYITLRDGCEAQAEFVDRKSRFIAQLVHVESEDAAREHIETVRARHYDARHNVPAWILADGREHASDDGEPQRTSGMPTLEVLRGAELKDVCCVTTRYFGGTLLGSGGLVRAYTAAAQAAIEAARETGQLVEMTMVTPISLTIAYAQYDQVAHMLALADGKVTSAAYTDTVTLHIVFRAGEETSFISTITELMAGKDICKVGKPRFAEF